MKMIKGFTVLLGLVVILANLSPASGADLFVDTHKPIPSAWENVDSGMVIRQRPVCVQFDSLAPDQNETLQLNFFDDVHVIAIRDRVEFSEAGGRAWIGMVASDPNGSATLVWRNSQLTGTVYAQSSVYQVRHIRDELHLVREILTRQSGLLAAAAWRAPNSDEDEVVTLVNQERQIHLLPPLQKDSLLHAAAWGHSEDMALNNYFSHTSQDDRDPDDRIAQAGYDAITWGENIAAGYSSPMAVVEAWMNSSGHRANILEDRFCDIGVGWADSAAGPYRYYWTQNFGRKKGVTSCEPAPQYTINAVAESHGDISPAGIVTVASGGRVSFTITAAHAYRIKDVLIDDQSVGPVESYTFKDIRRNHTIKAFFTETPSPGQKIPPLPFLPLLLDD